MPQKKKRLLVQQKMKKKAPQMTEDEMLREIESLKQSIEPPPEPKYFAPGELWPGESTDLGGFLLAQRPGRDFTT